MSDAPWTARRALSDGLRAAGLWFGTCTLALAALTVVLTQLRLGTPSSPALLAAALVTIGGGLLFTVPVPRPFAIAAVLTAIAVEVGGYLLALVALAALPAPPATTAAFPLSPFKTAMLAFAVNAGRRRAPMIAGIVILVAAEALSVLVGGPLGIPWAFDLPETATLALIALASSGFLIAGRRTEQTRRASVQAVDTEALVRTRAIARSRAAAVVHDTVLGDLAALAAAGPGPLSPAAGARLRSTLAVLASPDWAAPVPTVAIRGGLVLAAVEEARQAGLVVQLEGEPGALADLAPDVERALAAAVEQCLVNVRRHAGTGRAELTVLTDGGALTAMVSDSGVGFDPDRVDASRLGLATSVRARVEEAGGSVRVFAHPGVGTSVLLTVPTGGTA